MVRTARFLGRTFDYGYVVTRDEPDRLVELRVERPFPMQVTYELEDAPGGEYVGGDSGRGPTRAGSSAGPPH